MRDNISESSEKMKMILLSNTTKPEKDEKPARKTDESKMNAKKNLHYNFCNKNSHEEQICWKKYSYIKSKKERNEKKREGTKFTITMITKMTTSIIPQISKTNDTEWYIDSATSEHFSPYKHLFETYNELKNPIEIFTSKKRIIIYNIE